MANQYQNKGDQRSEKLTPRQEKFVELMLEGTHGQKECSDLAGFAGGSGAFRLLSNPLVKKALAEGRKVLASKTELKRERAIERLHLIIERDDDAEATKAIAVAAKMLGWNAAEKHEVTMQLDPAEKQRRLDILFEERVRLAQEATVVP